MEKQHNSPKPTNHYSERNIRAFLAEHFRGDYVMRTRLQNLFDGVRNEGYRRGVEDAIGGEIAEDIILQKRQTI
jgi:hypothetical protein